jgi:D-glycero-alpha-D-manno-heptose-7-phosphate kinase
MRCRAWCRVDLAGGTLDIWPLGLAFPGARTVNVAIDVAVRLTLVSSPDRRYRIRQGGGEIIASSVDALTAAEETALIGVFAGALDLPPFELDLASDSPRGGGLGGSSAIGVAFLALAEEVFDLPRSSAAERTHLARDLEARLMGLPTGLQDHYPALLGGALEILHRPGGERVRRLDVDLDALSDHLLLVDTGASHFSAGQNWQVVRRCLERDVEVRSALGEIAEVAEAMAGALERNDFPQSGRLLRREWQARSRLAAGISTPKIEELLDRSAALGGWGGKACGAGAGGCVALLVPAERKPEIAAEMEKAGGRVVPARAAAGPLELFS